MTRNDFISELEKCPRLNGKISNEETIALLDIKRSLEEEAE